MITEPGSKSWPVPGTSRLRAPARRVVALGRAEAALLRRNAGALGSALVGPILLVRALHERTSAGRSGGPRSGTAGGDGTCRLHLDSWRLLQPGDGPGCPARGVRAQVPPHRRNL